jgi:predicted dehydrogenase
MLVVDGVGHENMYDGGGSLINQSIHTIDLLQWIMGPVRRVHGRIAVRTHSIETEDVGVATLEFENGAFGVIEGTTSAYPGLFTRLEICGEKGTAVIENRVIKTWKFIEKREGDPKEEEVPGGGTIGAGPSVGLVEIDPSESGILHKVQYDGFVKAIKEDRKPLVDGIEAKKALEIILGIYRSAQEKREIDLPL